jgi:hypothetical protein
MNANQTNDVRERLQETARTIATLLPPHTGFVLLAFDMDTDHGRLEYVSNGRREDVVKVMREWIDKTESGYATHKSDPLGTEVPDVRE